MFTSGRKSHQTGVAITLALVAVSLGCPGADRGKTGSTSREKVTIGIPQEPLAALLMIAAEKEFLTDEGLDVTIVDTYPSGKRALQAVLRGEVDVTVSSEAPLMFQGFDRDDFRIVATIGSSDNEPRIIARTSAGINEPQDLSGKRIATQRGSAVHYFLHLFLLKHELADDDVDVSYLKAEQLPQTLADGDIDAFCMREPFISRARVLLDDGAVVFDQRGLYVKTMNLVARQDVVENKPEVLERILRALVQAEAFVKDHPDEARDLVATRLGNTDSEFNKIWAEMALETSLGHSLLVGLEDEARWAIGQGLVEHEQPPDYFGLFYIDAIKQVKPNALTVIQ